MHQNSLSHEVRQLLDAYRLPPSLGFGDHMAPIMYRADSHSNTWESGGILPFGPIEVNPAATSLQFAQQIFEGMKAYRVDQAEPTLFRPEMNFLRMQSSAARLCMPEIPAEVMADALSQFCQAFRDFVPGHSGQSLYLRPSLFGLDPAFGVKSSDQFAFVLMGSPSDAYYPKPIRILIERDQIRAAGGGTGAAKVGGNYAASLQATRKANEAGFDQPLWLDAHERKYIEELSAMNFMAMIDGALHTPVLNGSILRGVTRDSLLELAPHLGIPVVERPMPIEELLADLSSGRCNEAFTCGTGAIVCPVAAIGDSNGKVYELGDEHEVAGRLRTGLLDIQEGRTEDPFLWTVPANDRVSILSRFKAS